jgi:hypothetical protein
MKNIFRYFILIIALPTIIGCGKRLNEATLPIHIKTSHIYYTQVSLQYEKGRHLTTNYRKGVLVPVNTQVQLEKITGEDIFLLILPEHRKLHIENVEKHTGDNTVQAFEKLFNKNKVDLSRFSKLEQENIQAGRVAKGMSKKAVLAAIGYPPITETPSIQYNEWTYWSSRFNRFIVIFASDKVTEVRD